jgi:ChrR Cupin-like domain
MQTVHTLQTQSRCHMFDMNAVAWQATDSPGLWLKPARMDNALGHYLGLVRFDVDARSGLHQHQGVATSFVLQGGLTDHHGAIGLHEVGINTRGSTHDAVAHQGAVLVSRLEGPVTYPVASAISGVHAGSRHENFINPNPLRPPEVNVPVDQLATQSTGVAGITRQTIFDYVDTGSQHRMVQLTLLPGASVWFTANRLTEFWVRGGNLTVNSQAGNANCFVVCEAGALVRLDAPFGALLLAWAEGRESYAPGSTMGDLFGFASS